MEYKHVKTIEAPGYVIRVHSPIISEEERDRRMKAIYKAAENLLKKAATK